MKYKIGESVRIKNVPVVKGHPYYDYYQMTYRGKVCKIKGFDERSGSDSPVLYDLDAGISPAWDYSPSGIPLPFVFGEEDLEPVGGPETEKRRQLYPAYRCGKCGFKWLSPAGTESKGCPKCGGPPLSCPYVGSFSREGYESPKTYKIGDLVRIKNVPINKSARAYDWFQKEYRGKVFKVKYSETSPGGETLYDLDIPPVKGGPFPFLFGEEDLEPAGGAEKLGKGEKHASYRCSKCGFFFMSMPGFGYVSMGCPKCGAPSISCNLLSVSLREGYEAPDAKEWVVKCPVCGKVMTSGGFISHLAARKCAKHFSTMEAMDWIVECKRRPFYPIWRCTSCSYGWMGLDPIGPPGGTSCPKCDRKFPMITGYAQRKRYEAPAGGPEELEVGKGEDDPKVGEWWICTGRGTEGAYFVLSKDRGHYKLVDDHGDVLIGVRQDLIRRLPIYTEDTLPDWAKEHLEREPRQRREELKDCMYRGGEYNVLSCTPCKFEWVTPLVAILKKRGLHVSIWEMYRVFMRDENCPKCGKSYSILVETGVQRKGYEATGGEEVGKGVEYPHRRCDKCGFEWLAFADHWRWGVRGVVTRCPKCGEKKSRYVDSFRREGYEAPKFKAAVKDEVVRFLDIEATFPDAKLGTDSNYNQRTIRLRKNTTPLWLICAKCEESFRPPVCVCGSEKVRLVKRDTTRPFELLCNDCGFEFIGRHAPGHPDMSPTYWKLSRAWTCPKCGSERVFVIRLARRKGYEAEDDPKTVTDLKDLPAWAHDKWKELTEVVGLEDTRFSRACRETISLRCKGCGRNWSSPVYVVHIFDAEQSDKVILGYTPNLIKFARCPSCNDYSGFEKFVEPVGYEAPRKEKKLSYKELPEWARERLTSGDKSSWNLRHVQTACSKCGFSFLNTVLINPEDRSDKGSLPWRFMDCPKCGEAELSVIGTELAKNVERTGYEAEDDDTIWGEDEPVLTFDELPDWAKNHPFITAHPDRYKDFRFQRRLVEIDCGKCNATFLNDSLKVMAPGSTEVYTYINRGMNVSRMRCPRCDEIAVSTSFYRGKREGYEAPAGGGKKLGKGENPLGFIEQRVVASVKVHKKPGHTNQTRQRAVVSCKERGCQ